MSSQKAANDDLPKAWSRAAIATVELSLSWSDRAFCIGLAAGTVAGFVVGIALMAYLFPQF